MRIGIDCRLGGARHAGIGRYIENLILRLPTLAPDIEWVYFYHDETQLQTWQKQLSKHAHVEWILAPVRHYTLAEQLKMPGIFARAKLDVLHVPHFNIPLFYFGKMVITIHDLLWHEYYGTEVTTLPKWQYWFKYAAYRWVTSVAVSKAKKILVPTETIRQTLRRFFPQTESKTIVTREGATHEFGLIKHSLKQPQRQLVYVGSLYPHKNIDVVIKALTLVENVRLIIVGARNVFQDRTKALIKDQGVEKRVTFTGYLSDEKLAQLLHESLALIQPSKSEGFGLTGVEALATGVPVIASDIPIFREIYQAGALYFDPTSPHSLVKSIEKLDQIDRKELQQRGIEISQQYSWDQMASETLEVYHTVTTL